MPGAHNYFMHICTPKLWAHNEREPTSYILDLSRKIFKKVVKLFYPLWLSPSRLVFFQQCDSFLKSFDLLKSWKGLIKPFQWCTARIRRHRTCGRFSSVSRQCPIHHALFFESFTEGQSWLCRKSPIPIRWLTYPAPIRLEGLQQEVTEVHGAELHVKYIHCGKRCFEILTSGCYYADATRAMHVAHRNMGLGQENLSECLR